jgi:hypothetical protein
MRQTLTVLTLLGCLATLGCDDDTTVMMMPDMSIPPDLTLKTGPDHCLKVAMCVQACNGGATCIGGCVSNGTAVAQMKYQALAMCGISGCLAAPDGGGSPACSSATDPSAGCAACAAAYGQSNACSSQLSACLTDM